MGLDRSPILGTSGTCSTVAEVHVHVMHDIELILHCIIDSVVCRMIINNLLNFPVSVAFQLLPDIFDG